MKQPQKKGKSQKKKVESQKRSKNRASVIGLGFKP